MYLHGSLPVLHGDFWSVKETGVSVEMIVCGQRERCIVDQSRCGLQ